MTGNAFGTLKVQWKCQLQRNEAHISRMLTLVAVCAILHKFCEVRGVEFNLEWLEDLGRTDINRTVAETEDEVTRSAERIRIALHST